MEVRSTPVSTLSLHDALPISSLDPILAASAPSTARLMKSIPGPRDRKSTRLNSSHSQITYAVFCLKKNKEPVGSRAGYPHRHRHPLKHVGTKSHVLRLGRLIT